MDTKGLQKEFLSWCKSKNKSPKTEDETKLLFVAFMKEKHPEEYKQAVLNQLKQLQAQAQKAAHGAKLNYFKSLKNQCAEDEEVVYYKKGGSVGCGCKKKEDGGQVNKAEDGWKAKFKARKLESQQKNNTGPITQSNPSWKAQKPAPKFKNDYSSKKVKDSEKDYLEGKGDHKVKEKCGGKVKKHQEGSVIAKFKAHRLGGKLQFAL